ncbi:MAG TPA: undecaprenyldiphospho-muramoylpentapeptide beta-N-acetylglucosaminyltransferase [Sporolactobacillaceae bacterium]|nr:undecaprenyldiphospho-muramoylpentapeptide beta-N-acetylglucosaminyltransferase [Sporolactobacillaceae bacterium]
MKKKIILTGGGSAGHVTVNLALIPKLLEEGWAIEYIGSKEGIEKQLIQHVDGVQYHAISTGKLRRYFDWKNFKDPFKVVKGIYQSYRILKKAKPKILFSKGGFVSVPVILAARLAKVPSIIHESDLTPGLANKIAMPFANQICVTFPETLALLKDKSAVHVGAIVRQSLFHGDREEGLRFCGFHPNQPILLIMGGSLGAKKINEAVRRNLDFLLQHFQIVHLCGKGNVDTAITREGYKQFEYVGEELPHLLKMATIIISRAGSNALFEFLSLQKPMLLIPLPKSSSRGDQIDNAQSFKKAGFADVLYEETIEQEFVERVMRLYKERFDYIDRMKTESLRNGIDQVLAMIDEAAK